MLVNCGTVSTNFTERNDNDQEVVKSRFLLKSFDNEFEKFRTLNASFSKGFATQF